MAGPLWERRRIQVAWGIVPTALTALVGALLVVRPGLLLEPCVEAVRTRTRSVVIMCRLRDLLGPVAACVVIGLVLSFAVLWPFGLGIAKLESAWDRPVFDWFHDYQAGLARTRAIGLFIQLGHRYVVYVVAAVVLTLPRRRWAWKSYEQFRAITAVCVPRWAVINRFGGNRVQG